MKALNAHAKDCAYKIFEVLLSLEISNHYFNIELASILRGCFRVNQPAETGKCHEALEDTPRCGGQRRGVSRFGYVDRSFKEQRRTC